MTSTDFNNQSQSIDIPDITMPSTHGELSLQDYLLGHRAILAFYPADKSPVCSNQLGIYNEALPLFRKYNAKVVGISIDNEESHRSFSDHLNLRFPLISDHDPFAKLTKEMGVFNEEKNRSKRALFVFDKEGKVFWTQVFPDGINPGADGILKALDELEQREELDE